MVQHATVLSAHDQFSTHASLRPYAVVKVRLQQCTAVYLLPSKLPFNSTTFKPIKLVAQIQDSPGGIVPRVHSTTEEWGFKASLAVFMSPTQSEPRNNALCLREETRKVAGDMSCYAAYCTWARSISGRCLRTGWQEHTACTITEATCRTAASAESVAGSQQALAYDRQA